MSEEQIKALCEAEHESEASFKRRSWHQIRDQLILVITPTPCVKSFIV